MEESREAGQGHSDMSGSLDFNMAHTNSSILLLIMISVLLTLPHREYVNVASGNKSLIA